MRAVIDTNVVVSALLFDGVPGMLVPLWKNGQIKPIAGKEIIDEYLTVLAYPKFNLSEAEIEYLIYREILPYFDTITAKQGATIINQDPTDDIFLYCAQAGHAEFIIGDRHLLSIGAYRGIDVVSAARFLEERGNPRNQK